MDNKDLKETEEKIKKLKRAYYKKYRDENKDKINKRQREWRASNKDKVKQYAKNFWLKQLQKREEDNK